MRLLSLSRSLALSLTLGLPLALCACADPDARADAGADAGADVDADAGADADVGPDAEADAGPEADAEVVPDPEEEWDAEFSHVFPDDHVVALTLDLADGDWSKLLLDWQSQQLKNEYPADFTFDDESAPNVALRLKGLNSLRIPDSGPIDEGAKYPLKIDFNKLGGDRFHEVDELAMNAANSDASRMRDPFTARLYNLMGVDAPRTAWADVTIDERHIGLYVLAQVIDKRFLKERFGEPDADDGNLYKCIYNGLGLCSLDWRGDQKSDYVSTQSCAPSYDECGIVLQTNEDDPALNDYSDLIHFLDVLNHSGAQLETELPKVFDVDHFLRVAAVANVTSNYDSYFGKGHNFYLYRREDGRFQMIPWDFDLAWGNTMCPGPIEDPTCGGAEQHPLTRLVMEVPAWRAAYIGYLRQLLDTYFTTETLDTWVSEADTIIRPFVTNDPNPATDGDYLEQIDGEAATGLGNLYRFVIDRRADILAKLPDD